jgi:hypothetical protein
MDIHLMASWVVLLTWQFPLSEKSPAAELPTWVKDYETAVAESQREKKPLAVFLASGSRGWREVVQGAAPSEEIVKLLHTNYICVHIDTLQKANKELAAEFGVKSGMGLILSDRSGTEQAFRHEGVLENRRLAKILLKYADPDRVTLVTETVEPEPTRPAASAPPRPKHTPLFLDGMSPASNGRSC